MRQLKHVKLNRTGDEHGDWIIEGPVADDWRKTEYWHALNRVTGRRIKIKHTTNLGKRTKVGVQTQTNRASA